MDTNTDTAKFVRDAREKLGWSQVEFGKRIGRGRMTIWRYERGWELPLEVKLAIQYQLEKHAKKRK